MRYLAPQIDHDLQKKMVFVGGPRQCGKTTMAKALLEQWPSTSRTYLNWDLDAHRRAILKMQWGGTHRRVALDELHKFPRWKTWLKGIYDTRPASLQILVTGSARLDVYRKGGDSLLGRYHYWRLHPFCLAERPSNMRPQAALERLMTVGGFPEPFLDNSPRSARRWRAERLERVVRDDVRDLEAVQKVVTLQLFVDALRSRVGSPVVLANIAQDLQVSATTLKNYLEILEKMYLIFIVRPYTKNIGRAIQKPPKVYFYDNMDVIGDDGARFENLVATQLLKRLQFSEDYNGYRYGLHYIRDKEGREVDFAIVRESCIEQLIEVKWADNDVSSHLRYYAERLKPNRARQRVGHLPRPYAQGALQVEDVCHDLAQPFWPR